MGTFRKLIPQKARGKLVESMWEDPNWLVEEKLDGERRIAQFCGKVVRFTGTPSRVSGEPVEKTDQLPHLSKLINDAPMLPATVAALEGTVLDGELIVPAQHTNGKGGESKYVTSIANSKPAEAIEKQKVRGWLRYAVFDCLFWKGEDIRKLPLEERQRYAGCAVRTWGNEFVIHVESPRNVDKRKVYDEIVKDGGEGVVLKHRAHKYGDHKLWVKVKKVAAYDCVIIGYKEAKALSKKTNGEVSITKLARKGLIGAIRIAQFYGPSLRAGRVNWAGLKEVGTISGMDDALRSKMTAAKSRYINTVVEITANGREPTGRFRHPQFSRLRTDKSIDQCVYDQDES